MIDPRDIRMDMITNSAPWCVVKMTHIPTGITVQANGVGQYKTKGEALRKLNDAVSDPEGLNTDE